jgi:hypothetical protein
LYYCGKTGPKPLLKTRPPRAVGEPNSVVNRNFCAGSGFVCTISILLARLGGRVWFGAPVAWPGWQVGCQLLVRSGGPVCGCAAVGPARVWRAGSWRGVERVGAGGALVVAHRLTW